MALGALIGAYQEDDSGGLRALLPLAGRTLIEYQVRCAAAAGAAPIVVVVERVPQALQDAFERLRLDGIGVFPVSDVARSGQPVRGGVDDPADRRRRGAAGGSGRQPGRGDRPCRSPSFPTMRPMKRSSGSTRESRWAGVAVIDAQLLGSTAAMLGDWDLQSTLLRRAIQEGAPAVSADRAKAASRCWPKAPSSWTNSSAGWSRPRAPARTDWPSRYVLPPVEDCATERLMETRVRPAWLVWARAWPDPRGGDLLPPRLARRGARPAAAFDAARPGRSAPRQSAPARRWRRKCRAAAPCGPPPGWPLLALGWWEAHTAWLGRR